MPGAASERNALLLDEEQIAPHQLAEHRRGDLRVAIVAARRIDRAHADAVSSRQETRGLEVVRVAIPDDDVLARNSG